MAAVKPYFYRPHPQIKSLCIGVDIDSYLKRLSLQFNGKSLVRVSPDTPLPEGPVYYTDTPRNCHEGSGKYELVDAISDCVRSWDRDGAAKQALAKKIAKKIIKDPEFRESLFAYKRVPQSWRDVFFPVDESEGLSKKAIVEMLAGLADRDLQRPNRGRGKLHPLARIMESRAFSDDERLLFVRDYYIGKNRKKEAPWAVRIGTNREYREYNLTRWLEQNGAYRLETVGDVVLLKSQFTKANRLKAGANVMLSQLEPGYFKGFYNDDIAEAAPRDGVFVSKEAMPALRSR